MKFTLINGLPFVSIVLRHHQRSLTLDRVLVDTGSGGTILPIEPLLAIGIKPEPEDTIHRVRGIGGVEYVFRKQVECLEVGEIYLEQFAIEIGQIDYGFSIQGILGVDFLIKSEAIINFAKLEILKNEH
ncbi:hypothetical protein TI03_01855 [Achromatium sp. WMS1]|nr:hypothetical protein TI03_01855 [Achromatium sp. WMS1]